MIQIVSFLVCLSVCLSFVLSQQQQQQQAASAPSSSYLINPQFALNPLSHTANQQREHLKNYKTTFACEGNQIELNCPDGKLIHLVRANYGRFSLSICNDLGHSNYSVHCNSFRAFLIMEARCNKSKNCNVTVSKELFGDPCEGTAKYLELQYYCDDVNNNSSSSKPAPAAFQQRPQINGQQVNLRLNNSQPTTGAPTTIGGTGSHQQQQQQLSNSNIHKSQQTTATNRLQVGGQLQATTVVQDNNNNQSPPSTIENNSFGLPATTTIANNYLDNFNQQQQQTVIQQQQQQSFCSPQLSSRNLFWNTTRLGQVAQQACPDGATGSAQWLCDATRQRFVPLQSPDFTQCRSIWLSRLAQQLAQMLEAPQKQQPLIELRRRSDEEMLRLVLGELTLMARTKELFGEDLKRIDIMFGQMIAQLKSLAVLYGQQSTAGVAATNWRQRVSFGADQNNNLGSLYEQLFSRMANIVSSLFDLAQKNAWLELSASDRRQVEFRLLNHLKEAGLMLANSVDQLNVVEPVKFANLVAGITVLNSNSNNNVQRPNSDGTTNEFNLFQQQQVNKFNVQNPFADGSEQQQSDSRGASEFKLSTSLVDELASNGVSKFLVIDLKRPDYALMMRFNLEQQQQQIAQPATATNLISSTSSSQFANDYNANVGSGGSTTATLFDSSSSASSLSPTTGGNSNLAADRFTARIFGLFAIVGDSGITILDSHGQQEQIASTKQLEISNKVQDSLAQWPINVEFKTPPTSDELVAHQCNSLSLVASNQQQQEPLGNNRCQLTRSNATNFVCTCDRFGFVSLTSVPTKPSSFPFSIGLIQNDQWPTNPSGSNFDFGQSILSEQQLLNSRQQDNLGEYGQANYIQSNNNKSGSSLNIVTSIFIFIGIGLLVLSLGACGVSLVMRVSSANGSKFGKKQKGFLDTLGATRGGPTTGPMVIDHNLLGSDPLVNSSATTQSASIIGLSAGQQHQSNTLITSCNEHNGTYKTHQQLYAANMNSANFNGGIYSDARGDDFKTTFANLITRPANWLASLVGLKGGYIENNYKANQMIHHHHQNGLLGSSMNTNHSTTTANTLTTTGYKCQNGYTTSLGLYNQNQHHLLAQQQLNQQHTLNNHHHHQQQPQHSVPMNSSSNSSYVSSSAYYEEIGPGNLTKVNPTSMTNNHHHHQQLTSIEQFKRTAELQQQQQQQQTFNNWSQRTLNSSNVMPASVINGQQLQTMGSNKHLIQHNDLSPLQSSSSSSSAGSQHSASTNLTTANSSTPRHYLFASPSAVSAYKQQFKNHQ